MHALQVSEQAYHMRAAAQDHDDCVEMILELREHVLGSTPGLHSTILHFTPAAARWLRTHAVFERQRRIRPNHVVELVNEMDTDRFIKGTQVFIAVYPDGGLAVLNANHTLEALGRRHTAYPLTLTMQRVADIDEAGDIYAVFDIGKMRSWNDSLKATGRNEELPNAAKFLSAIGVIEKQFYWYSTPDLTSRRVRIEKLDDYREQAELINAAKQGGVRDACKFLERNCILAVALETMRAQPSEAFEFWQTFAHDNGLVQGMPERTLLQFLRADSTYSGNYQNIRRHSLATALAWNAKFEGRDLSMIRIGQSKRFWLKGTPWK